MAEHSKPPLQKRARRQNASRQNARTPNARRQTQEGRTQQDNLCNVPKSRTFGSDGLPNARPAGRWRSPPPSRRLWPRTSLAVSLWSSNPFGTIAEERGAATSRSGLRALPTPLLMRAASVPPNRYVSGFTPVVAQSYGRRRCSPGANAPCERTYSACAFVPGSSLSCAAAQRHNALCVAMLRGGAERHLIQCSTAAV